MLVIFALRCNSNTPNALTSIALIIAVNLWLFWQMGYAVPGLVSESQTVITVQCTLFFFIMPNYAMT